MMKSFKYELTSRTRSRAQSFLAAGALTALALPAMSAMTPGNGAYVNDFTERQSAKPVEAGVWHEMPYLTAAEPNSVPLGYGYPVGYQYRVAEGHPVTALEPFSGDFQDGWRKAYLGSTRDSWTQYSPSFGCSYDQDDVTKNPYGQFAIGGNDLYQAVAVHPINNAFSNGVVRLEFDVRVPEAWVYSTGKGADGKNADNNCYARAALLFDKSLDPVWGSSSYEMPAQCGLNVVTTADGGTTQSFLLYAKEKGGGAAGTRLDPSGLVAGHWYRFSFDHDLDACTLSGFLLDMGTDHPTFASAGMIVGSVSGGTYFYKNPTAERGPVTGIALQCRGIRSTVDDVFYPKRTGAYDNIRVSWKAPGASSFAACYENDFAVRRYRVLNADQAVARSYDRPVSEVYDTYAYPSGGALIPASDATEDFRKVVPPLGLDGWRRHNSDGRSTFSLQYPAGDGGAVLMAHYENNWGAIANSIGVRKASGKIRLQADFRLPDVWHWKYTGIYLGLGGDRLYRGVQSEAGITANSVCYAGANGNPFKTMFADGTDTAGSATLTASGWYRVVMTADLDRRKTSYTFYSLGANSVAADAPNPESVLEAVSDKAFPDNGVTEVTSFVLCAYGQGPTVPTGICFDNIKIWTDPESENEKLVYANDFSTRRRLVASGAYALTGTPDRNDGFDDWHKRNGNLGVINVLPGANACLSAVTKNEVLAVQKNGLVDGKGASKIRFQCDVRPPSCWAGSQAKHAWVYLGGDELWQVNTCPGNSFEDDVCLKFGFTSLAAAADPQTSFYYSTQLQVQTRADAGGWTVENAVGSFNLTHWHRFVFVAEESKDAMSLEVYDMGAAQPEMDTACGGLVTHVDGLTFPEKFRRHLTTHGIHVSGVQPASTQSADDGAALFDNFRWDATPDGLFILVR